MYIGFYSDILQPNQITDFLVRVAAAITATRELGRPIVAMALVLIAVYVPIGFQSGLTGALLTEFAFTLPGAVTLSGIVALILSRMMCAHMLRPPDPTRRSRLERLCDVAFAEAIKPIAFIQRTAEDDTADAVAAQVTGDLVAAIQRLAGYRVTLVKFTSHLIILRTLATEHHDRARHACSEQ
jgi:multidrug efflux pump subunit AcrB